jgi:Na+/proline symporter
VLHETIVLGLSLGYLGLLFAIAYFGDKHARKWTSSRLGPIVYGLSLAIYCTSWTFYGAVGRAATSGLDFILIYVGPILVMIAGYPMLRKIVTTAKRHNVTSIADLLGSRYGKSRAVAVSATLIASVGALPYIALQLQAVSSSFTAIAGTNLRPSGGASLLTDTSFIIAALMALFTILFGVRHVQAAEHRRAFRPVLPVRWPVRPDSARREHADGDPAPDRQRYGPGLDRDDGPVGDRLPLPPPAIPRRRGRA